METPTDHEAELEHGRTALIARVEVEGLATGGQRRRTRPQIDREAGAGFQLENGQSVVYEGNVVEADRGQGRSLDVLHVQRKLFFKKIGLEGVFQQKFVVDGVFLELAAALAQSESLDAETARQEIWR